MTSTCNAPCMHAPQRCAWNSSNESPRSASHHEETLGKAVRNAARRIEYKHHLHAIGVRGSDPYNNQLIRATRAGACEHSVAGALDVITSGIRRDRACSHNAALPDVWVGSDTIAIFAKSA